MTTLSDFDAVQIAEGLVDASPEEQTEAWQQIIDSGLVWQLQGWFGRTAMQLIREGVCQPAKRVRSQRG